MTRKWLICAAWPYINAIPHLGTMIGSVLSADVAARYFRIKGDKVVFVSGSDEHGTPIEVEAIKKKIKPEELTNRNHEIVKNLFDRWYISFDNYTRTESEVHKEFVRKFYTKLYERGYIFEREDEIPYCPVDKMYLPDRFIVGECPYCGYKDAKGDQCDNCGRLLTPRTLMNPRCAICGSKPILKRTKHWYIDLTKLEDRLREYIENNEQLPVNARKMSISILKEGLQARSLTRDNKWGIPAPFPGAVNKTIYVWMEAVLGYISATIEYFRRIGNSEGWKEFWLSSDTRSVYFIGKDNIPFHTLIFPALLMASGENYVLPWTVASTEYLLFEGQKFSKSRRIGIWIDEALELLPVDYWRFTLIYFRPELRDINFSWKGMVDVVNSLLNDTIGNLIHRVLSMIWRNLGGEIKRPEKLKEPYKDILRELEDRVRRIEENMESFRLRNALLEVIGIASLGNKFLNETKPWEKLKKSLSEGEEILYVAFRIVKALAVLLYPFIPMSAKRLWEMLGFRREISWREITRDTDNVHKIEKPKPLFKKISTEEVEDLLRKLEYIRSKGLVPSAKM